MVADYVEGDRQPRPLPGDPRVRGRRSGGPGRADGGLERGGRRGGRLLPRLRATTSSRASTIDYATGDSWAEGENISSDGEITYILNTSSLRFHEPDCAGAARIAPANRQETTTNRELLLAQGYQPCGTCKP